MLWYVKINIRSFPLFQLVKGMEAEGRQGRVQEEEGGNTKKEE